MAKVKPKISGGFRSERGGRRHSILLSIIETAKKQKMNIPEGIQKVLDQSLVFKGARQSPTRKYLDASDRIILAAIKNDE